MIPCRMIFCATTCLGHSRVVALQRRKMITHRAYQTSFECFNTIKLLYSEGRRSEALEEYFKLPNAFGASYLIAKQEDINVAFKIYHVLKENKGLDFLAVMSLVNLCRNKQEHERLEIVWDDVVDELEKMDSRRRTERINSSTWSALLLGLCKSTKHEYIKRVISLMEMDEVKLGEKVYTSLFFTCVCNNFLELGQQIYAYLLKDDCKQGIALKTCLVTLHAKSGNYPLALEIFNSLKSFERDLLLWNSMIFSYGQVGNGIQALHMFERMQSEDVTPNEKTIAYILIACCTSGLIENATEILFSAERKFNIKPNARHYNIVLSSCTGAKLFDIGKKVHVHLVESGCPQNIILKNSLLNMYAKSGDIRKASAIFNDIDVSERCIVTWSTMIKTCHTYKMYKEVLQLFEEMQQSGVQPNETVVTDVLSAYCCSGLLNEALEMLYSMKVKFGVKPNAIHYSFFLDACANNGFFEMGKLVQEHLTQNKCKKSVDLMCSLINFYSKCGFLEQSLDIFNNIGVSERNNIVWDAIIEAYGENGKGKEALTMFEEMQDNKLIITEKTIASILNVCGRAGLIEEFFGIFTKMEKKFNMKPNLVHCNIVVDTLCRIGRLEEAEDFISRYMRREKIEPDINTFMSLLMTCKKQLNVERIGQIAKLLMHTNQENALAYMLLLNNYTKTGDIIKEKDLRDFMETRGIMEIPDVSIVEINGKLYQFTNHDQSNLDIKAIESELEVLNHEVMKARCGSDIDWEIHGVVIEKEKKMCLHSEKLAISCAIINTAPSTTIRISKNVRVHDDCHDDIKLISKIRKRDIIIKDSSGFHRFKDGTCTCNDHW